MILLLDLKFNQLDDFISDMASSLRMEFKKKSGGGGSSSKHKQEDASKKQRSSEFCQCSSMGVVTKLNSRDVQIGVLSLILRLRSSYALLVRGWKPSFSNRWCIWRVQWKKM